MKVEIPDRVCPHCGGTTWTKHLKKGRHVPTLICHNKVLVLKRKYRAYRKKNKPIIFPGESTKLAHMYADILTPEQYRLYMIGRKLHYMREFMKTPERRIKNRERLRVYSKTTKGKQTKLKRNNKQYEQLQGTYFRKIVAKRLRTTVADLTEQQIERYRTYLKTLRQWQQVKRQQAL